MTAGGGDGDRAAQPVPGGRIETVLGRADDMRAEVYVRFVGGSGRGPLVVSGTLAGPRCGPATTLPVTVRLVDLGGTPPVSRGILTEPSFWTPELPNLYRLDANVLEAGTTVASTRRLVGLRRLGVRGRSLWLEGRRWVPRAAGRDATALDVPALRAASLAAVIGEPSDSTCEQADGAGVAVIALLDMSREQAPITRILEWSQHPSVVMTILPPDRGGLAADVRGGKGTMLIGLEVDGMQPPPRSLPAGVDCLVVHLPDGRMPHEEWRQHAPALPVLARRPAGDRMSEGRDACDGLQAELAAWGCARPEAGPSWDWAGYLVG